MDKQDILMLQQINNKLGFDLQAYDSDNKTNEAHKQDNIPNPFDKLSLEELLFIRKHRNHVKKKML